MIKNFNNLMMPPIRTNSTIDFANACIRSFEYLHEGQPIGPQEARNTLQAIIITRLMQYIREIAIGAFPNAGTRIKQLPDHSLRLRAQLSPSFTSITGDANLRRTADIWRQADILIMAFHWTLMR
jgi:hypothetical protein